METKLNSLLPTKNQKNNKINQTINQVAKKLEKLFTFSPYTTLAKTKKSFLSNFSNNRYNAAHPKPYNTIPPKQVTKKTPQILLLKKPITPNVDKTNSNYANFLSTPQQTKRRKPTIHINYEIFQFFFLTQTQFPPFLIEITNQNHTTFTKPPKNYSWQTNTH